MIKYLNESSIDILKGDLQWVINNGVAVTIHDAELKALLETLLSHVVAERRSTKSAIAVDFDGVIHKYSKGWSDGTCYDVPVDGAEKALQKLVYLHNVFILSSRDPKQIQEWMKKNIEVATEIIPDDMPFWNKEGVVGITQRKLPAIVYIDDRAIPFTSWPDVELPKGKKV